MHKNYKHAERQVVLQLLTDLFNNPYNYVEDEILQKIANELIVEENTIKEIPLKPQADEFRVFGQAFIEDGALQQMNTAMRLPVSMGGSLMPDAHQGYGLPIGGVLATNNAVIPFGVGVDIGCRMCLTIYDVPAVYLKGHLAKFKQMLMEHTRFGINCSFEKPIDDEIFERPLFNEMPLLRQLKDRAYRQIGTSGSGNHFVEFGEVTIQDPNNEWDLETTKTYIGILSHSGSRGLGANIAQTYTKIAMEKCPLPNEAKHLAWLDLDTQAGQEYWLAMNLAGDYASACHHQIHRRLAKALGAKPLAIIENHHNFAWKEIINEKECIVHRKGATPAAKGVLGIIPGSMTSPGYIVKGYDCYEDKYHITTVVEAKNYPPYSSATITRYDLKPVTALMATDITITSAEMSKAVLATQQYEFCGFCKGMGGQWKSEAITGPSVLVNLNSKTWEYKPLGTMVYNYEVCEVCKGKCWMVKPQH